MLHRIRIFASTALERLEGAVRRLFDLSTVNLAERILLGEVCREFPGTFSKHQKIRERVSTKPICSIDSSGAFARCEKSRDTRHLRVGIHPNSTHDIMRGWADFHRFLGNINVG